MAASVKESRAQEPAVQPVKEEQVGVPSAAEEAVDSSPKYRHCDSENETVADEIAAVVSVVRTQPREVPVARVVAVVVLDCKVHRYESDFDPMKDQVCVTSGQASAGEQVVPVVQVRLVP